MGNFTVQGRESLRSHLLTASSSLQFLKLLGDAAGAKLVVSVPCPKWPKLQAPPKKPCVIPKRRSKHNLQRVTRSEAFLGIDFSGFQDNKHDGTHISLPSVQIARFDVFPFLAKRPVTPSTAWLCPEIEIYQAPNYMIGGDSQGDDPEKLSLADPKVFDEDSSPRSSGERPSAAPTMAATWLSWLRVPMIASSGLAALGSGLLYFKQNEIIYPRNIPLGARTDLLQPEQLGIENAESLYITTPDNESLHAFFLRPPNVAIRKNVTVLMFHGNAGNVSHRLPIGKVLAENLGCHVFMLEYRGYGLSSGDPDENGLVIDAQTAFDYVRGRDELKNSRILIYGQSLGGAVAIKLVADNQNDKKIVGLILENTFTSIRKMIPSAFPPAKFLARLCHQIWPSDEVLPTIKANIPMLFLSGLKDEIVPPFMMKALFDVCKVKRKVWHALPEGHHNDTIAEPGYFDAVWKFLVHQVCPGEFDDEVFEELTDDAGEAEP